MIVVEAQVHVRAARPALWSKLTDIEDAARFVRGIERIELLDAPARGLVGLKWRETRILFDKPESIDKWITAAVDGESFTTRAEMPGFVFLTTHSIAEGAEGLTLTGRHETHPQGLKARLMAIPMRLFFRGTLRKAILADLDDFKQAAEGR